jgi:hypothetical protein
VVDVAREWESSLNQAAADDPAVTVTGSRRSHPTSGAVAEAPKITPRDVLPLVRGLGAVGTRMARVSDLTESEVSDIAEPSAHLLSLLAPNMPPWAIPLGTLGARIGQVVEARKDEFRANQRSAAPAPDAASDDPTQATLIDEF